ncbi:hypothetical protein [Shewanella surugensis]|uniref:Uncharacterized protein n=1 Tax=Shewanella surugensis TaxID=212020 RepID=A0ABT0LIH1_9GAMM|nr:hypothetical protein [Shewanella surugensis]MCL1127492.1 hypothetical protein [Shewanella surugensis]
MQDIEDVELTFSPLSRKFEQGGQSVEIDIFKGDTKGWILEIIATCGTSTVWEDPFESDQAALDEALTAISNEGIESFSGYISGKPH